MFFFVKATHLVQINDDGVKIAAKHVSASDKLRTVRLLSTTFFSHVLHIDKT